MAASFFLFVVALCVNLLFAVDPDCVSPLDRGLCNAAFQKYGFDINSGRCQSFTYGGCGGNRNRYDNKEFCIQACLPKPDCRSLLITGPCRAGLPRFGFNKNTGHCQSFTYGGCGGNNNNYDTLEECQKSCI
ncbi:hypothetical protein ACJJTC_011103 [Scirpophaga incertulas]